MSDLTLSKRAVTNDSSDLKPDPFIVNLADRLFNFLGTMGLDKKRGTASVIEIWVGVH